MLYTIPDYYKEFHCVADQCEDTCCAGWQIVIDPKALKKYKRIKGPYRKKLWTSIRWFSKTFRQTKEKRCAFLTDENLCAMYQNLGEKSLCRTCKMYPRHVEEFENVREISLSLSCPEVAKILMNRTEKVTFLSKEKEGEEEYEDFDFFLYSLLLDLREFLIEVLQNRDASIEEREQACLIIARKIEQQVKEGALFVCQETLDHYREHPYRIYHKKSDKKRYQQMRKCLYKLHFLEVLKSDWKNQVIEAEDLLFRKGFESYLKIEKEFEQWLEQEYEADWKIQWEQIMVYFIFTYFCGAVYDEKILANVQAAVTMANIVKQLMMASWLRNEKILEISDVVDIVYRFSRELEHSDKNLKVYWQQLD